MKKLILLTFAFCFIMQIYTYAEWKLGYKYNPINSSYMYGSKMYFAGNNGISVYDTATKIITDFSVHNSDLPSAQINSILKISTDEALIGTKNGLCLIQKGEFTGDNQIVKSYPESEARYLYSFDNSIWTFSNTKVLRYKDNSWKSYDLSDSIKISYDIRKLVFYNNNIWVIYNDLKASNYTFYDVDYNDLSLNIAILEESGKIKPLVQFDDYPWAKGQLNFLNLNDKLYMQVNSRLYEYNSISWKVIEKLYNCYSLTTFKGNIWGAIPNSYLLCKYNPIKDSLETFLNDENLNNLYLTKLDESTLGATGDTTFYIITDTIKKFNFKIREATGKYYYNLIKLGEEFYIKILYSFQSNILLSSIYDKNANLFVTLSSPNFPYNSYMKFCSNREKKSISNEYSKYSFGVGVYLENIFTSLSQDIFFIQDAKFKNHSNGLVYFNRYHPVKNNSCEPYLMTYSGKKLINVATGIPAELCPSIDDFDMDNDNLYVFGSYHTADTSYNSYVSIINASTGDFKIYDKNNSKLPDWYETITAGYYVTQHDTVPYKLAVDENKNCWISTRSSLIKVSGSESVVFTNPNNQFFINNLVYDKKSKSLLGCYTFKTKIIFIFNTISQTWDSLELKSSGIIGGLSFIGKLADGQIWAGDSLGFAYIYDENLKFKPYDFGFKKRNSLGSPICHISIDYFGSIYVSTPIGLFYNLSEYSPVEENLVNNSNSGISIFPNPASDYIEISLDAPSIKRGAGGVLFEIFNIFGELQQLPRPSGTPSKEGEKMKLDVSNLAPGVYFIRIGDKFEKFIKL